MSGLPVIPELPAQDPATRRFGARVREVCAWITGQQKNSPKLPRLNRDTATIAQLADAYEALRQRLDGSD